MTRLVHHLVSKKPLTNGSGHKVLLIVDIQVGLYEAVRDFDPTVYRNNILAHAAIGKLFDLPVVLTTSAQTGTLLPFTSSREREIEMNATRSKWAASKGDPRNVSRCSIDQALG